MSSTMSWVLIPIVILVIIAALILWLMNRFYLRASKDTAFVRTGLGGQHVIINAGALVLPVFHEVTPVNLSTVRLVTNRSHEHSLITRDRLRVDVEVAFYVRVAHADDAVAKAAQTLGRRTLDSQALGELIEGKFIDALRVVASQMTMEELHENRGGFINQVRDTVATEIRQNGLELESASLTDFNQTSMEFFNPSNAFDAQGLTKLTEEIERRRKIRNDIEQDTQVQIRNKNLETEKINLDIERESQYAQLEQERELEVRRARQRAELTREKAERDREAEVSTVGMQEEVEKSKILSEHQINQQRIEKALETEQKEILKQQELGLAEQQRQIILAENSEKVSAARAKADEAKVSAVSAEEDIYTTREVHNAKRKKDVELVLASLEAERQQLLKTMAAETDKTLAESNANVTQISAQAKSDRMKIEAEGYAARNEVEAKALQDKIAADNTASPETQAMRMRLHLLDRLEGIIHESAKPLNNIDSIRVLHTGAGQSNGANDAGKANDSGFAEQLFNSALQYRAQAPLIDHLIADLGLADGDLNKLKSLLDNKDNQA